MGACEKISPLKMKPQLIDMLCRKSFQYSADAEFRLASGKRSRFYVNCKPVTLSPMGMYCIGHLVLRALSGEEISAVGGLTFGADPIAAATAFASFLMDTPVKAFSIRKNQKDHGMIRWIEGDVRRGERAAVIDDVATTGASTIKAVLRAQSEGLVVEKAVILVDRQEGGLENIRKHVPDATALITRTELMDHYRSLNLKN